MRIFLSSPGRYRQLRPRIYLMVPETPRTQLLRRHYRELRRSGFGRQSARWLIWDALNAGYHSEWIEEQ